MFTYKRKCRLLSAVLAFLIVLPLLSTAANAAEPDGVPMLIPVYAFCNYEISMTNAEYIDGHTDNGAFLTDRNYGENDFFDNDGWVAFQGLDGKNNYTVCVTLDLGAETADLSEFFIRITKHKKFQAAIPRLITFFVSDDGNDYVSLGTASTVTDVSANLVKAVYRLTTDEHRARYVKAEIEMNAQDRLYINEVAACVKGEAVFSLCNREEGAVFTDAQGLQYTIENGCATVIGVRDFPIEATVKGSASPSEVIFDKDGIRYVLGSELGNPVTVINDLIKDGQENYSGAPNMIDNIVIHNTGTPQPETDAERYNSRLHSSGTDSSWHYTVDNKIIYHSVADSLAAWHAGSSMNYHSIGIEICVNGAPVDSKGNFIFKGDKYDEWVNTTFRQAMKNAAVLTAELMTRYGLTTENILQHYDATGKNCPMWMRSNGSGFIRDGILWKEFMEYVADYFAMLNTSGERIVITDPTANVKIPSYVVFKDGFALPVKKLGSAAFADKSMFLKSVFIPNTVTEIAANCFSSSYGLSNVTVAEDSKHFKNKDDTLVGIDGTEYFRPLDKGKCPPLPVAGSSLLLTDETEAYYISGLTEKITLSAFESDYGRIGNYAVSALGVNLKSGDYVGNGTAIVFDDSRAYILLKGDGNGNGVIDASDYSIAKRGFLGTLKLTKMQIRSLAINSGTEIAVTDYAKIKRHVLGTFNIYD